MIGCLSFLQKHDNVLCMNHSAGYGGPLRYVGAAGLALSRAVSRQWGNLCNTEFKQPTR